MRDKLWNGDFDNMKTVQNTQYKNGQSRNDKSYYALLELSNDLSAPLKKMHATYLENARENCYQEKHISDDFTKAEQIDLCKREQHQALFGEWTNEQKKHRDSDVFKLHSCLDDAGMDSVHYLKCTDRYIDNIRETNSHLKTVFASMHKEFM